MEDREEIIDEIGHCMACRFCFEVCPSYAENEDEKMSPMYRLYTIKRVLQGGEVDDEVRRILDGCTLCGDCDGTCPEEIGITEAIRQTREFIESGE
jgi:Fe-S oxidoreductase